MKKPLTVIINAQRVCYLLIALVLLLSPSTALADVGLDTTSDAVVSSLAPDPQTDPATGESPEVTAPESPAAEPSTTLPTPDASLAAIEPTTEPQDPLTSTSTIDDTQPTLDQTKVDDIGIIEEAELAQNPENQTLAIDPSALAQPNKEDTPISDNQTTTITQEQLIHSTSGDVTASDNQKLGDATTGDSLAATNTVNIIQSQSSLSDDGKFLTFVTNIQGDVYGDLLIDPAKLGTPSEQLSDGKPIDVNISSSQTLDNNLTVAANSGSATLSNNRYAGNVTTGDAEAVANVINMLNSAIAARQSFLGIINIYGNLNGDILLPEGFIDSLIANNTPSMTVSTNDIADETLQSQFKNIQTINNNVSLSAISGSVNSDNTKKIGDITTGNANTNLTIFNLAGAHVSAANSLLVFVNVLGEWIGFIVNSPDGATAAALGGGDSSATWPLQASMSTSSTINNNITVAAQSGDISLLNNRKVGDVHTGDATASANILNIINSQLSLSNWFGILFINVFGSWHGSFGVNTAYGGGPVVTPMSQNSQQDVSTITAAPEVFKFIPTPATTNTPAPDSPRVKIAAKNFYRNATPEVTDTVVLASSDVSAASDSDGLFDTQGQDNSAYMNNNHQTNAMFAILLIGVPLFGYGLYRAGIFSRLFA